MLATTTPTTFKNTWTFRKVFAQVTTLSSVEDLVGIDRVPSRYSCH
jgi:hypothetical protein